MQSFLEGRPIYRPTQPSCALPQEFEPFTSSSAARPAAGATRAMAASELDEPQVELLDHDGRIERIIVTCTCCKRIELQCQY